MAIGRWPSFPPVDATQWLIYFSLAGLAIGLLDKPSFRIARSIRIGLFTLVSAGFLAALLRFKFSSGWTPAQGVAWIAALLFVILLVASSLHRLAGGTAGRPETFPLLLTAVGAGTAVAIMFSGSLLLGQLAMIFTTGTALLCLAIWWTGTSWNETALVPVATLIFSGLWICGYFFADLPAASALLLALSAPVALIARRPNPWIAPAVAALIASIAAGIAIQGAVPMEGAY
ncbi:MAG: hypothetical protein JWL59_791 [Chthoniobacteraceae bacterium]|nr:hypothetical protein [Chthoniobacteraceae bacterium]